METLKKIYEFMVVYKLDLVGIICGVVLLAEMIVRLTPTKKDDGAVQRIGSVIKKILDFLGLPNNLKA